MPLIFVARSLSRRGCPASRSLIALCSSRLVLSVLLYLLSPSDYGNIFKWAVVLGINNFIMNNKALIEEARKERQVNLCKIILK